MTRKPAEDHLSGRRLLSPIEAATYLGLPSRFAIYRLVSTGTLPAVRLANKIRIDLHDLDDAIEQAKASAPRRRVSVTRGPRIPRKVPQQLAPLRSHKRSVTSSVTAKSTRL
jgi:excisionase family DNA binding protein